MYVPNHFEENRREVLHQFMDAYPFALLVTLGSNGIEANSLPCFLDATGEEAVIRAHVARANPVWRETRTEVEALMVFQGPHGYVTPSWYPTKQESGKVVPTWNYMTVHARGLVTFHQEPEWIRAHISELTGRHEASRPKPWAVDDAPADFIEKLVHAIVGVELRLTSLRGKWKLSQNRPAADREGVVQGLAQEGDAHARALSDAIARTLGR